MALFCLSYGPDGKVAEAGGLAPHSRRNARFSRPPRRLGRFGFRGAPGRTLTDNPRLRTAPLCVLSYWSMEIGSPGWIHTSTVPLNRRADYCYPTEQLKMVSAAGLAPAFPRSQAECVGCYATRCSPRRFVRKPPGSCFLWRRRTPFLETGSRTRMADPKGVAPWWPCASTAPADNEALC